MLGKEKADFFFDMIKSINRIIQNNKQVNSYFDCYVSTEAERLLFALEPCNNKFIRYFQKRRLFPRLINDVAKRNLLSRFRCESHREILLSVLKQSLRFSTQDARIVLKHIFLS